MKRLANSVALVTGATGFVGAAVVRRLLAEGADVHIMARNSSKAWRIEDVLNRVTVWGGDVTDRSSVEHCMAAVQPELIFHLAGDTAARSESDDWSRDESALATNFYGAVNALRAAHARAGAGVRLFVRAGGLAEYGACRQPMRESQREQPLTAYAASQAAATHWLQMAQERVAFAVATLRLALTYGPQQSPDFFVPAAIDALLRGDVFEVRAGERGRDYVFVEDVAEAFLATAAAEEEQLRGAVINIASGENVTLHDVAAQIAEEIGRPDLLRLAPLAGGTGIEMMRADITKVRDVLDWRPATPLRRGLALTVAGRRKNEERN